MDITEVQNKYQLSHVIFSTHYPVDLLSYLASLSIQVKPLLGVYKGLKEQSFLMSLEPFSNYILNNPENNILKDQESVLFLTQKEKRPQTRAGYIGYLYRESLIGLEYFGLMQESQKSKDQDFSYDPMTKKFFTCTPKFLGNNLEIYA